MEEKGKPEVNFKKNERHLWRSKQFVPVRKKPLESYYEGCRKTQVKKRNKKPKPINDNDVIFGCSTPTHSDQCPVKQMQLSVVEENIRKRSLEVNIKAYEVQKKQQYQRSAKSQRRAEKNYLEQQENLIETWLTVLKRQREVRDINSDSYLPTPRRAVYSRNEINIFLLSKKFWKDDEESPKVENKKVKEREKAEEKPKTDKLHSILDEMEDDFYSKLVFIDEEDSEKSDR